MALVRPNEVQPTPSQVVVDQAATYEEPAPVAAPVAYTASVPAVSQTSSTLVEMPDFSGIDLSDLQLDFRSFPMIKIANGSLQDQDGNSYGTSLSVVLLDQHKKRFCYRATVNGKVLDRAKDVAYSLDEVTTTAGRLIEEVVAEWKAAGKTVEPVSMYFDALAMIADSEQMVILQIPPTSLSKYSGYIATLRAFRKVGKARTKANVGPIVRVGANSWNPWEFKNEA